VKRAFAVGLVALSMVGLGTALAPSAAAHSELVSSDPADGATLEAPPTTVTFTFNEPLMPDFVRFIATDPAGQTGDVPVSSVDGPTAVIAWPAGAPGGEWTVNYRVVSQDGHPIEGGITFSYVAASPSASPSSATASPSSASASPVTPTTAAPTSAAPSPSTSPTADTSGSTSGLLIAAIAVGVIVIAGVAIALVARRRT